MAEVRADGAARAEPSLLELCRVVTEEEEVKEEDEVNLFGLCRVQETKAALPTVCCRENLRFLPF